MNHKAEHKMLKLAVVSTCTTYFNIQNCIFPNTVCWHVS